MLRRSLGDKAVKMVLAEGQSKQTTRNVPTPRADRARYCVTDEEVLALAGHAVTVERHYGRPMDIEWAKDRLDGLGRFQPGEILVADTTTPDWEPVMKTAAAIVTNRGGRTCHAAIVARELATAVVGTGDATAQVPSGEAATVSCAEGEEGRVYRGTVPFSVSRIEVADIARPRTNRMEFIISEDVKIRPLALVHPEKVTDRVARAEIDRLTAGYPSGEAYFVERLSEGIGTITAAFWPKPVVVPMSDFKTDEYANLIGGADFEPVESNPMLGFRGASRHARPGYEEGFALECRAMRRVREKMGLTNVVLMLPFVRRVAEADRVLARMAELGLVRGEGDLEIYAMCEVPNDVVLVDRFARRFEGLSIGSNDLTQLTLGVDRDSETVAFDYDERDDGVQEMIKLAVEGCRRNGIHSGICGQAPSDYPDFVEYLVTLGIDSVSLNPDTVVKTTLLVLDVERRLAAQSGLP